jgi:Na+/melibiose symporter-like transporter
MMKNRDSEALTVIRKTGGHGEAGARKLLSELRVAHERQEEQGGELSWTQTLCPRSSAVRGTVAVAIALGLAQQLTGTEAILYYTPVLFAHMSEYHQFLANLSVGFCKFIGELFAAALAECVGRRSLMIYGNLLLCASVFGIAASFQFGASVVVSVMCLSLVMLTFSIGAGPFTFVVVNEMLPLS